MSLNHGEFVCILGPSGCGKTTILQIIGGFVKQDSGSVSLDGQTIDQLPPNKRTLNTVFQNYALFPHMTIYENISFGLRMEKKSSDMINAKTSEVADIFGLTDILNKLPNQLSGGQQQRAALARAVVKNPKILLLDEPLSALDYKIRQQMQFYLKNIQRKLGITFIFVTHDQEEALSIADRVIVMNNGNIEQIGTPKEIYESPTNLFVANFVGEMNVFEGKITSVTKKSVDIFMEDLVNIEIQYSNLYKVGEQLHVLVRPEDMRIINQPTAGKLAGKITEMHYKGATLDSVIELINGKTIKISEFFDEAHQNLDHKIGEEVFVEWVKGWEVILKQ